MSSPAPAPVPDAATSGSNRSGGRGGGRDHRRNGRSNQPRAATAPAIPKTPKAPDTAIADIGPHYFECHGERSSRPTFKATVAAIQTWVTLKCHKFPDDLAPLFHDDITDVALLPPAEPDRDKDGKIDPIELFKWQKATDRYDRHAEALSQNLSTLRTGIWAQCSETMKSKLRATDGFDAAERSSDCHWYLRTIKAITHQFDGTRFPIVSLLQSRLKFLTCRQKSDETVAVFIDNVRNWASVVENYGGQVAETPRVPAGAAALSADAARERTLATLLIMNADPARFASLQNDLANKFILGEDKYPVDVLSASYMLTNYKPPPAPKAAAAAAVTRPPAAAAASPEAAALTFVQTAPVPGTNGSLFPDITCHKCHRPGHYADVCPGCSTPAPAASPSTTTGTTLVQHAFVLAQSDASGIDPNWILLDSQSTVSVFRNPSMLTNIRPSGRVLHARTNGGHQESSLIGDFPNLGPVWYNPDSIANIISLADARRVCTVSMNTSVEPAMILHRKDGSLMKFVEHSCGLYVFVPTNTSNTVSAYSFLQTVAHNKQFFSKREIDGADAARAFSRTIGRPSQAELEFIISHNLVLNCPVTIDDVKRAFFIYGPDIASVKGTTRRGRPAAHVPSFRAVPIPSAILATHRNVTLSADFFYVQGLPFFHSISRGIGYRTVRPVSDRSRATILAETQHAVHLYQARGFTAHDLHADHEFECIRHSLLPIALDVVAPDSHVGEIERSIETVKGRLRSAIHGLPFKRLPRVMIQELVLHVTECLNMFPRKTASLPLSVPLPL